MSNQTVTPQSATTQAPKPSQSAKSREKRRRKQGFFCIWHGMNASRWRELHRLHPEIYPEFWLRCRSIDCFVRLNSLQEWICERLYSRAIDNTIVADPPVFVLGHWRSGTTLLHELLTLNPRFASPTMYQVLFSGHFLLTESWMTTLTSWLVPKTRPMDNMAAHWNMPQEDEVALLLRTLISPYMMLLFPKRRDLYEPFFELEGLPTAQLNLWIEEFLRFIKSLTYRYRKPLVLKSPPHTYRVPLLLRLFPQARFVYIYRHPVVVYQSSMHLRRVIFRENGMSPFEEQIHVEDVCRTYEHCIERYESTKHLIPPGQLCEVRFEDLEAEPVREMSRVYQELQLTDWPAAQSAIETWLPQHYAYRKNQYQVDKATIHMLATRWKNSFDRYGYDPWSVRGE